MIDALADWFSFNSTRINEMAQDPTNFSYWIATNLPIGDGTRMELLKIVCTLKRLQLELSLLQRVIFSRIFCNF
jgi:hypothetical protein